ncbi:MAG: DNA repair protein RecN [Myxococcales bacterium]|nr:DNA repair protein RecN [Myxococcales bacterium]
MLRHLRVTNFAILSDVSIEFAHGFNALTGETGAGKSLIVEAVNLLRGGRASADIPRAGAEQAVVEAIFEITDWIREPIRNILSDAGLPLGEECEDELLVRRVIHKGGRSRTYINGALTTASRLADMGGFLVDLSGQHQHQGLVDPKRHRAILDSFASNEKQLAQMKRAYEDFAAARTALQQLENDSQSRDERLDYLRFQLQELREAELCAGEGEELERERSVLASVDKLHAAAAECESQLYGADDSAVDRLNLAARALESSVALDPSLADCSQLVSEARTLAEEAARSIQNYVGNLDADPARLADIDDRLAHIRRLTRKHACTLDDLVAKVESLEGELHDLDNRDERVAELKAAMSNTEKVAKKTASTLRKRRKKAAGKLEGDVSPALAALGMPSATLFCNFENCELSAEGHDRVELLLAANTGETAKPLSRVASGGELSRIMLALKLVLRRADTVSSYVFDEVDTGIGGGIAEVVGQQIRQVANERQVLCVTHLPQIAAFADVHFHVSKSEAAGRTETCVTRLTEKQRLVETARMVGGVKVSAQAKAHAKAMLAAARS